MAAELATIARPYAEAAFGLARDEQALPVWSEMLRFASTIVTDPQYLNGPWVTTSHFKKEPDGSKWNPQPCKGR